MRWLSTLSHLLVLPGLLVLAPRAVAGGVRILDTSGGPSYPTLQAAIDAAVDGDVLLIGAGTYPSAVIDGKGLALLAVPGSKVTISGLVIINQTWHNVVLAGMTLRSPSDSPLRILSSTGSVRAQSCEFEGGRHFADGLPAVRVEGPSPVVLVDCTLRGLDGISNPGPQMDGGDGGHGLVASKGASVYLHRCSLVAGDGGYGDSYGGSGGTAYFASNAWLAAVGSQFQGGDASYGYYGDGYPGYGIQLTSPSALAELLTCFAVAGKPLYPPLIRASRVRST